MRARHAALPFVSLLVLLLALLPIPPLSAAPLHYFRENGQVGLKDDAGRVLVPACYSDIGWTLYDTDPQGGEIEFMGGIRQPDAANDAPNSAAGDVYDRRGNYLYSPISFDNGTDYWEEGYRRFIEGGKVGFVDGDGRKVIPAQYAAATPFFHGYATVYTGRWRAKQIDGGEHAVLEAVDETARTHVINRKGETVAGSLRRQSPQDVKLGGRYYPDPFTHSPFEQDIVTRLNAAAVLTELAFWHDLDPRAGSRIRFAITTRPSRIDPYYRLSAYQYDKDGREPLSDSELSYIVADHKGHLFYRAWGETRPILLKTWLRGALKNAQREMACKPELPNRFDAARRLRELPQLPL